jgi:hypothetical protein
MRRAAAAAATAVLLTTLGACGGGDGPDEDDDTGGTPSATAGEGGEASASDAVDPCDVLTVEEVGDALGAPVTATEPPGGGCGFEQDDPRAPSVGIFAVEGVGGGFESSKAGLVVDGEIEDVPDVGDDAWVAVGAAGGRDAQGQGIVMRGDQLVNVTILQGDGLDAATVKDLTVAVLTLAASTG